MNFELESSSSSEIDTSLPPRRLHEASASSEDDDSTHSIDEALITSIRKALHLSVGNICREQDAAVSADSNLNDYDGHSMDAQVSFRMSQEAVAALTDLTYHYTTTLFPNDLVSFSSHAGRKIIKPEDVMLMARKDKKGVGADMKKKLREIQARSKNNNKDGKKSGKKSVSPRRRKSDSERSTSPVARKKSPKPAKKSGKLTKSKNASKRSRSSKANPEIFSSDSSGDEEDALAAMCQRVEDMKRRKSASKNSDDDLNDFVEDDTGYFNNKELTDSEIDFQIDSTKKKKATKAKKSGAALPSKTKSKSKTNAIFNSSAKQTTKNNALFNSSTSKQRTMDHYRGLSDSDSSSDHIGKVKFTKIGLSMTKRGAEGSTEDMAIDLGSGSD
jgi:histone H3/H4